MEEHESMEEEVREPQRNGLFSPFRSVMSRGKAFASWGRARVTRRGKHMAMERSSETDDAEPSMSTSQPWWQISLPSNGPLSFFQQRGSTSAAQQGKTCFPQSLMLAGSGLTPSEERQELVAVGSRHFGHPAISSLIRVKIYDFALYMDRKQARESLVCKQYGSVLRAAPQDDLFYQRLRSSSDVKMALMVRASRNLPIKLLAGEYERILRRRLSVVGGSPDDPALAKMVAKFREEELPEAIKHKKSVRKGTVLVFTRDPAGLLCAAADQHDLIAVHSRPLCDAIFDLYIGDQPVSKRAKRMTGESFVRLVGAEEYCAPREALVCEAAGPACQL